MSTYYITTTSRISGKPLNIVFEHDSESLNSLAARLNSETVGFLSGTEIVSRRNNVSGEDVTRRYPVIIAKSTILRISDYREGRAA